MVGAFLTPIPEKLPERMFINYDTAEGVGRVNVLRNRQICATHILREDEHNA